MLDRQPFWRRPWPADPADRRESGQSIVLVVFGMVALLAFVGIAVDVGFVYARNAQLSSSIDAAALAGATEVRTSNAPCMDTVNADRRAIQFLNSNNMPQSVINTFYSCGSRDTIGFTNYAITATWPVPLFFLRVIGLDEIHVTQSATAAYYPLVDIYASRRVEDGALSTSNQSVFGPQICTEFGDPFSPFHDPFNFRGSHRGDPDDRTYHYRILIPPDYPSDIVRVELFDPDSINQRNNVGNRRFEADVTHTSLYIDPDLDGLPDNPAVERLSCATDRKQPCIIVTNERSITNPPYNYSLDQVNPFWFVRIDENRGGGPPGNHGNNTCDEPESYQTKFNTVTLYELFFYQDQGDGTVARVDLASYSGQSGDYTGNPADPRDYDNFSHETDMHWVSPGGQSIYDQPAEVPADCNSRSGYSITGERTPRCPGRPYSPPGAGRGFEISLSSDLVNIVADLTTNNRYLYLDVTTLSGASENGFEIWAGPPDYVNSISSNVNSRNVQIINNPGSHSSRGTTVFGIGQLPMNSNAGFAVDIPLIYVGPEYAGEMVEISLFDSDAGAQSPVVFYFDSIAFDPGGTPPGNNSNTDYSIAYGVGDPRLPANNPDGQARNCTPSPPDSGYSCNNLWVTPPYVIQVPTLNSLCNPAMPNPLNCTPFYGGRLVARYIGGTNDTYGWEVRLPGLPFLVR